MTNNDSLAQKVVSDLEVERFTSKYKRKNRKLKKKYKKALEQVRALERVWKINSYRHFNQINMEAKHKNPR